jgi:hypothetical protein
MPRWFPIASRPLWLTAGWIPEALPSKSRFPSVPPDRPSAMRPHRAITPKAPSASLAAASRLPDPIPAALLRTRSCPRRVDGIRGSSLAGSGSPPVHFAREAHQSWIWGRSACHTSQWKWIPGEQVARSCDPVPDPIAATLAHARSAVDLPSGTVADLRSLPGSVPVQAPH